MRAADSPQVFPRVLAHPIPGTSTRCQHVAAGPLRGFGFLHHRLVASQFCKRIITGQEGVSFLLRDRSAGQTSDACVSSLPGYLTGRTGELYSA